MRKNICLYFVFILLGIFENLLAVRISRRCKYEAKWKSLDSRPTPQWFDEAKVGIFIHWGVYSVPSFGSEWFWPYWKDNKKKEYVKFMNENYPPGFSYQEFAKDFTAEFFDPDEWAKLFQNSGAKFVVLTTKHHEGYTLWPSTYSFAWNARDVGPHRDLTGDLSRAIKTKGLKFGVYYSLFEWYHPLYLDDKKNAFKTQYFVNNKMLPEMYELVNKYQPSIFWSEGDWMANDTYFKSAEFLAWLYNDSPVKDTVLVNDKWGNNIHCRHGNFHLCRYGQRGKRTVPVSIDKESFGFRRNAYLSSYRTTHELIEILVETVSSGGNILINIGATKEGTILPIVQERLLNLGQWLSINGEAIYKSKPWMVQKDNLTANVWYTTDVNGNIYVIVLQWPNKNVLRLDSSLNLFCAATTSITLLGNSEELKWSIEKKTVLVQFPDKATVISEWAWVLKISHG